jgi:hypothetical protein
VPGKGLIALGFEGLLLRIEEGLVDAEGANRFGEGTALLGNELDSLGLKLEDLGESFLCHDGPPRAIVHSLTRHSRNQNEMSRYGVSLSPAGRWKGKSMQVHECGAGRSASRFTLPDWHIPQSGWKKPAIIAGKNREHTVPGLPAPAQRPDHCRYWASPILYPKNLRAARKCYGVRL